jgi:hypothetical protein
VARPVLQADVDELADDLARNELLTAAG